MRIGFMRLIDAAPLVVASARGYFDDEGIAVDIEREGGWMIVRDKLTYGLLDASHSLLGMSIMSQLGRSDFVEPMVAVMNLGAGGSTLVVSTELAQLGVDSPQTLRQIIDSGRLGRKIICAHVSTFSMHHYLLRDWLARGGIDPDHDIQLVQLKPILLADHMSKHYLDLFCVGEPWGSLAESRGWGRIALATTDIYPDHPEKVLLTTESCARQKSEQLTRIIRALIRACAYCQAPEHHHELAELLSQPEYVDESQELIMHSLEADHLGVEHVQRQRRLDWHFRSWQLKHCTPSVDHVIWFLQQMIRWGHLGPDADVAAIAARCVRTDLFDHATADLETVAGAAQ
ncbi:MAG: CmpA/NrtA family ABC transporter substrate-binding protein [Phycisphaerae bacterium]